MAWLSGEKKTKKGQRESKYKNSKNENNRSNRSSQTAKWRFIHLTKQNQHWKVEEHPIWSYERANSQLGTQIKDQTFSLKLRTECSGIDSKSNKSKKPY